MGFIKLSSSMLTRSGPPARGKKVIKPQNAK